MQAEEPMITIRLSKDRGHFDFGWLKTYHTFSFGDYYDEAHHDFRQLRVINEDWIKSGEGFPTHSHRDMEIITYVISGALAHKDSMGNGSTILPGDVQYMSAGTGVQHSEYNHSKTETTHLLQIWVHTKAKSLPPLYGQKSFSADDKKGKLCLLVSGNEEKGAIQIRQDVKIYASILSNQESIKTTLQNGRHGWVQVIEGGVSINGQTLDAGDGAQISGEEKLTFTGQNAKNEFLFFDLN